MAKSIGTKIFTRALAVFLIAFSGLMLWVAYHPEIPFGQTWATNAIIYPKVVLFLLLLFSVLLFFQKPEEEEIKIQRIPLQLGMLATFFTYTLLLPILGYLIGTFLWVSFMTWMVGERRMAKALFIGFLGTILSYLLFWVVLRVSFPEGKIIGLEWLIG